ncbi:hypothetical protein J6S55_00035, partial [Candidatus Saccharibacteria bacterium]|nr:hypothetical protein [Candidatus Saccharibacteria bacterium]
AGSKKEEVKQYDGDSPNMADSLTGVISYAGVSGGDLIIRVNIDQYLTTGNCGLTLKRDGNIIYSVTTNIEGSVSTSTCNGFKISSGELSSGKLEIEIALESGDKRGKILGEATI